MQDLLVWKHTIQRCGMVWVVGRGYRGFLAWVATKQLPLWSSVPKYQYLQHLEWSPELDSKGETISIRQPVKMSNFKAEINTFTARYKKQFCSVYSECSEVLKPVNQLAFSHFKLPCFKVCRVFFFLFFWLDAWNKICSKNVLWHKIYHHQCSSGESLHVFKTAAQLHSFFFKFYSYSCKHP